MSEKSSLQIFNHFSRNQQFLQFVNSTEFLMKFYFHYKKVEDESRFYYLFMQFQEKIFGILTIFEIIKLKLRYDKWRQQKWMHIFISESNPIEKQELEEEVRTEQFEKEWIVQDITMQKNSKTLEELKLELRDQLEKMKKTEKFKFNQGYQHVLDQSHKTMGVITTLPILSQFKRENTNKLTLKHMRKILGESLFILRPLIYCILLYIYGSRTYTPYFVSLLIDLLRYFLERDIEYYRKCEKYEMNERMKDLFVNIYILFKIKEILFTEESILCQHIEIQAYNSTFNKTIQRKQHGCKNHNFFD